MTCIEIIDETVEYYSNNPRSINDYKICTYHGENGEKCAFSRLCEDDVDFSLFEGRACDYIFKVNPNFMENLKEEYRYKDLNFYRDLQRLHDNESYWKGSNLSEDGESFVEQLKETYNEENS